MSCEFSNCVPSKSSKLNNRPDMISTYNDLTRSEGGFVDEYLDRIVLRGRVIDKNCLPVSSANISIWQKDSYGTNRYPELLAIPEKIYTMGNDIQSDFFGTGTASSDNEGRFIFITVFPSKESIKSQNGYINLMIQAHSLKEFMGEISLKVLDDSKDKKESDFIPAYLNQEASDFYGIDVYDFAVVMDGHSKKYRY